MATVDEVRSLLVILEQDLEQEFDRLDTQIKDSDTLIKGLDTQIKGLAPKPKSQVFFDKYGSNRPFKQAGDSVAKSIGEFKNGIRSIQNGDAMGGGAAIVTGVGSLAGFLVVGGPIGAIIAGAMAIITALISVILDALKPAIDSLESKLKRIIEEETLNQAYIAMAGGKAEWEVAEKKIGMLAQQRLQAVKKLAEGGLGPAEQAEYEAIAAGWTWEDLTQNIGWEKHKGLISAAFMALSKKRAIGSPEWMALFDITIAYASRFYCSFVSMAGLVGDPYAADPLVPTRQTSVTRMNNMELFAELRKVVLRQLRDDIDSVYFEYQNNCQFYHLYKNNDRDYLNNKDYFSSSFGKHGQRTGVIGDNLRSTEWLAAQGGTAHFAVTSRGTVFSVGTKGTNEDVLYAGRGGGKWEPAEGAPKCDQVFVTEDLTEERVIVLSLHNYGQTLSVCTFKEAAGAGGEGSPRDWSSTKARWGTWQHYDFTATGKTILTVLATPMSDKNIGYSVYVLAYSKSIDVNLYQLDLANRTMKVVNNAYKLAGKEVSEYLYSAQLDQRSAPSPCAISYIDGSLTVQYGHRMHIPSSDGIKTWELRSVGFLDDSQIKVYQGRHYPDGTIVLTTNKGVKMMYRLTPTHSTQWGYSTDIETICSWKQCSTQVKNLNAFYSQLTAAANNL
jgi:hypothetical protein